MQTEMRRMTPTATRSTWLKPLGRPGTAIRHLLGASTPTAVPMYAVKLRATAALEKTYSMIRFAPVRNAANSPARTNSFTYCGQLCLQLEAAAVKKIFYSDEVS